MATASPTVSSGPGDQLMGWGPRLRSHLGARRRLSAVALLLLATLLLLRDAGAAVQGQDLETALASYLAQVGLRVDADSVVWLGEEAGPLWTRPAVFLASRPGELPDLYHARVRAVGEATVLDVWMLTNVTRSSSAAEGDPIRVGDHLALSVRIGDEVDAIEVIDLRGEDASLTADWPTYARVQDAITNLQHAGRLSAFGRQRYHLVPPALDFTMKAEYGRLIARLDGETVVLEPGEVEPLVGRARVRPQEITKGRPGMLTWLVDTVRGVSWIGPAPIEWLEHTVFGITDRANRAYYGMVDADTEAEVREAMALPELPAEQKALLTEVDPELQWPPAALEPALDEPVKGEGEWLPIVDRRFVNAYPNAPAAFYQTFIRVDPEREFTRVYVTLWDPRQVQLHIAMGTREPESATGETGSGQIPREAWLLERVVGAFNGGFQALHGEFGMMSEGRVYLPPKPFAATVAVYEDGQVGMGSWPGPGRGGWDEEIANQQIPGDMIAMRQNLTSVVEDGTYNPWKRWWWGAAPEWAKEQTYIHRSGLCLTDQGHMAYFWGESMGPEQLGAAMLSLDCVRGMHLDMNSKHTGLELYRPFPPGEAPEPLGRKLTDAEFEGKVRGAEGFSFRARKAITTMTPLRFPRYLRTDPRDFFYLTLKSVLPGPDLRIGNRSIPFETAGLPHAGWPPAFARLQLATGYGEGTWLVRIDGRRVTLGEPAPQAPPGGDAPAAAAGARDAGPPDAGVERLPPPLALLGGLAARPPQPGEVALWRLRRHGIARHGVGPVPAGAEALLSGQPLAPDGGAAAALGVDEEGFLLYAEADAGDRDALFQRLARAGVDTALALPDGAVLAFLVDGKPVAVDGRRGLPGASGLPLRAVVEPPAGVVYPDVEPRPYRHWGWLQGRRVRYFPQGEPRFKTPEDAAEGDQP